MAARVAGLGTREANGNACASCHVTKACLNDELGTRMELASKGDSRRRREAEASAALLTCRRRLPPCSYTGPQTEEPKHNWTGQSATLATRHSAVVLSASCGRSTGSCARSDTFCDPNITTAREWESQSTAENGILWLRIRVRPSSSTIKKLFGVFQRSVKRENLVQKQHDPYRPGDNGPLLRTRAKRRTAQRTPEEELLSESRWTLGYNVQSVAHIQEGSRVRFEVVGFSGTVTVREAVLAQKMDTKVVQWCLARLNKYLTRDIFVRYGLQQLRVSKGSGWEVDEIMYVRNMCIIGAKGMKRFCRGPAYIGRNVAQIDIGWQEIVFHSLRGPGLESALVRQGVLDAVECSVVHYRRDDTVRIQNVSRDDVLDKLDKYCTSYPMKQLRVSSLSGRQTNSGTKAFQLNDDEMFVNNTNDFCLQAALENAMGELGARHVAEATLLKSTIPIMTTLSKASKWVQEHTPSLVLRRVRCATENSEGHLKWLLSQSTGVFIVRVRGHYIDHAVCVDCENRRLLDSVENRPLVFNEACFVACMGGREERYRILEMREVRVQLCSGRKRKRRMSGATRRKKQKKS